MNGPASIEIDGFELLDEIGRGGFGTVYRAADRSHGRNVAIKVLARIDEPAAERRFDRERRAMGTLSGHPNIAVVYTSGFTTDHRPFIAMELLLGGSLADRIDEDGPMAVDDVVAIGVTLCDALAHAHAGGVLHLDMKPENVLLSDFGHVKVVDFGIAALVNDEKGTTTIRATPSYADPAVLEGNQGTVATDVYGLAATLYALLTGVAPYATSSGAMSTLHRIANDPVPTVERDDVPIELTALLRRAMAKDPVERPPTVAEFRRLLVESASGRPAPVPSTDQVPPAASAPRAPARDRSTLLGVGMLVTAVVLLIGVIAYALRGGDDVEPAGEAGTPATTVTSEGTAPATTEDSAGATPTTAAVPDTVIVPDVSGRNESVARTILEGTGLAVRVTPGCQNEVDGTQPPAGSSVLRGATVFIVFPECRAPDFVGLRLPEAIELVESYEGIRIEWPDHCDDLVLAQEPAADSPIDPGTTIALDLPSDC